MDTAVPAVVEIGMFVLPLAVAALFVAAAWAGAPPGARRSAAARAALGVLTLLGIGGALAISGVLADASRRPPAFPILMALCTAATVLAARSSFGASIARLPLWALVGAHGFRFPLELVMHRAASASVMPPEMTFGGLNYDVVTGASALVLAAVLYTGKASRAVVAVWNVMGTALLAIIVTVAFAA